MEYKLEKSPPPPKLCTLTPQTLSFFTLTFHVACEVGGTLSNLPWFSSTIRRSHCQNHGVLFIKETLKNKIRCIIMRAYF